jgi:hypothetical protein
MFSRAKMSGLEPEFADGRDEREGGAAPIPAVRPVEQKPPSLLEFLAPRALGECLRPTRLIPLDGDVR